jgi:SAM-dependent methyltransferase
MKRELAAELMDDPRLEGDHHRHALRGLSRLNFLSGGARLFWPTIARLARQHEPLRILDLATGAGDLPLGLWRRARRAGVEVEIHGVDVSPRAARFAQEQAGRAGAPLRFEVLDVLSEPLPSGFDVIVSSLFLHHVDEQQAVLLLRKMRRAASRFVLISDLDRSARGLALAYSAARLFTTSGVVRADAPRSVRAAFTFDEMRDLARRAELDGAELSRHWPFRLLLKWQST